MAHPITPNIPVDEPREGLSPFKRTANPKPQTPNPRFSKSCVFLEQLKIKIKKTALLRLD